MELVQLYWDELVGSGYVSAEEYPFDLAWARYQFWGSVSWIFIISVMSHLVIEEVDTVEEATLSVVRAIEA